MCYFPYQIRNRKAKTVSDLYQTVSCGQCPACRKRRATAWAFRMKRSMKEYPYSTFVTFTYSDEHLPASPFGMPTLNPDHVRLILKSMRKRYDFKYFLCGEYGSKTERPHYHAIILGKEDLKDAICRRWRYGRVHFGKAESASIRYVTGYLNKTGSRDKIGSSEFDDRVSEFQRQSHGLGFDYDILSYIAVRPESQFLFFDGYKISVPRYYKKLLFKQHPHLQDVFANFLNFLNYEKPSEEDARAALEQFHKRETLSRAKL